MKIRHLLAALVLGILPVSAAHAVGIAISIAPPPIPVVEQPLCPVQGYLWTPGYYAYDDVSANYYWVDGVWVPPPRVGYLWTPGYWGFGGGVYAFHTGYWGPTVGFYGGINYGCGYGGYGYYGGRWDGGAFRYNTAVTRVNVNNIHNTYVDNHFQARTNNRASFNGRGGIEAKADASERRAAQANHLQATAQQRQARDQARTARNANGQQNAAAKRDQARTATANNNNRTPDARRDGRTSRADNVRTNNPRVTRNTASRNNGARRTRNTVARSGGRNRTAFNPGRGRSRGGQPRTQRAPQRAPQPRGGGGGGRGGGGGKKR